MFLMAVLAFVGITVVFLLLQVSFLAASALALFTEKRIFLEGAGCRKRFDLLRHF